MAVPGWRGYIRAVLGLILSDAIDCHFADECFVDCR
jgi:hypothetical protein